MRVIIGGTFDPVHHGHLRLGVELRERLGLAQVAMVPCHLPPHRDDPGGSADQRLAMLETAVWPEAGLTVDGRELDRDRPSYTVETLESIRDEMSADNSLAMVVGTDSFAAIDRWHQWPRLLELAHIIVVSRPGYTIAPDSTAGRLLRDHGGVDAESLRHRPAGCIWQVEPPLLQISATGVRQRIRDGRSVRYLLPDRVIDLIHHEGLYGAAADGSESRE